jgi:anti-sigma factor RsiW
VHLRSLQEQHLVDIASSEPQRLQAWFRQRLPYPVAVPDLSAHGYALVGGRVDYLYAQALAAVVYRRNGHLVNVLIWPSSPSDSFPSVPLNEDRLNVLFFRKGDTNFCAISDLTTNEFKDLIWLLKSV